MLVQKKVFQWGENDFSSTLFRIIISNTEIEEELHVWINPREIREPGLAGENSGLPAGGTGVVPSTVSLESVTKLRTVHFLHWTLSTCGGLWGWSTSICMKA